ncbi:DUF748 domain-containing protein [Kordiimonas lacus]|uniref:OmpA family protein n=1 Tax=Kordiimonas lacus TaxID=637679 RepID=A0A1G6ZN24_9PROT|nr:DUF748 domain-containing protein [Kordiimonas lacus]SDE02946.1 OmpA family protein [Kordiimonas lacus]
MPKFLRRFIVIFLVLTGIYVLASPFVVPWYVQKKVRVVFAERVDGTLAFSHVAFNPVSLTLLVRDLDITDSTGKPVLKMDAAHINISWRTLWSGQLHLQSVVLDMPALQMAIAEDGRTSLEAMLRPPEGASAGKGPNIRIDKLAAKELQLALKNHAGHEIAVGPLDLALDGFATAEGYAISFKEFGFALGGGKVTATGEIGRAPLSAKLHLELSRVPLKAIMGFIPLDDLTVTGGQVTGPATLTFTDDLRVQGDFDVSDFAATTTDSLVRRVQVPYASAAGFDYDRARDQVSVDSLTLGGGVAEMVRATRPDSVAEAEGETDGVALEIRQALLSGGKLVFEDQTFDTPPVVTIDGVGAIVMDFRLADTLAFSFQGDGYLGQNSPVRTAGYIEARDTMSASFTLEINKLDHAVLKPYLYRTLGRASSAGEAYLQFDYYIEDGQLDGTNSFLFDRWEWGDRNPAYEGEEIPLKRAFNLLEDKGSRVAMEIPVDGEYLDPTFRVDGLVRQATNKFVGNLITTPFRLIGKLIPGGKKDDIDLDKVRFDPSSAELAALEKARLTALAKALQERPKVRLQIDGVAVPGLDLAPAVPVEGEAPINQQGLTKLANMRADAVYQYLIAEGIAPRRLEKVVLPLMEMPDGKKPIVRLELLKD